MRSARAVGVWASHLVIAGALVALSGASGLSQEKLTQPKVVFEKNAAAPVTLMRSAFGHTCKATGPATKSYKSMHGAFTVAQVLGAPIAAVKIRSYPARVKQKDIQDWVLKTLATKVDEPPMSYEPWDEWVRTDIVATIQFADKKQGAFEESTWHVCLTDDSGAVWWMRIPWDKTKL